MAKFFCEYCGQEYNSVFQLTNATCRNHPNGPYKGKHKLYEGGEKSMYTCKYCGQQYRSLFQLTGATCRNHPDGPYKGKHSPAL